MNKIGFAFSGILVITGIITWLKTTMINLVMPQIGRVAFQSAMAGSYTPNEYHIDFIVINILAVGLIVIGSVSGYLFYRKETGK